MSNTSAKLLEIYHALLERYGPQGWWPAADAAEVVFGAILVQHTSWRNVSKAIDQLKHNNLLDFKDVARLPDGELAAFIRPAGTPRVKARRLKEFARWLGSHHDFDLQSALAASAAVLRQELLGIAGIGPETADCILLYAAGRPSFVVDTYTRRVLTRHLLADPAWGYQRLKDLFESHLQPQTDLYNEFHALMVRVGREHCRTAPRCASCPLEHLEHHTEQPKGGH